MNTTERLECMNQINLYMAQISIRRDNPFEVTLLLNQMFPYVNKLQEDLLDELRKWIQRKKEEDSD